MEPMPRKIFGCSPRAVQDALSEREALYEQTLGDLQTRLTALREENETLKAQQAELQAALDALRSREAEIASALVDARSQARQVVEEARGKAQQELESARGDLATVQAMARCRMESLLRIADELTGFAQEFTVSACATAEQMAYIAEPVEDTAPLTLKKNRAARSQQPARTPAAHSS